MKSKLLLSSFLEEILKEINELSEADIKKLESGEFSLSLKVTKKTATKSNTKEISDKDVDYILDELRVCTEREKGFEILVRKLKTRKDLEKFARIADVHVMKQDKVDRIREKIIEGIIGASLRSTVIQG